MERFEFQSPLCSVCQHLGFSLDLTENLDLIVEQAAKQLKAKASSLRLLDPEGRFLELRSAYGLSDNYLTKGPIELSKSLIDQETLKGQLVEVSDAVKDPGFQYREEAKEEGISSVISVPLYFQEMPVGVLRVYTSKVHKFSDAEKRLLATLAFQGGIAIRHAQRYDRLHALYEIARQVNSTLDLHQILEHIAQLATKNLRAKGCNIMLLAPDSRRLGVEASYVLSEGYLQKGPVEADRSLKECLAGNVVEIEDINHDDRLQYPEEANKEGISSIICLPLRLKEKIIGVIRLYSARPRKFTGGEMEFLETMADMGVAAIENARLFQHVKRDYDSLVEEVLLWYDWGARPPGAGKTGKGA